MQMDFIINFNIFSVAPPIIEGNNLFSITSNKSFQKVDVRGRAIKLFMAVIIKLECLPLPFTFTLV
jgi:hypothetical protein